MFVAVFLLAFILSPRGSDYDVGGFEGILIGIAHIILVLPRENLHLLGEVSPLLLMPVCLAFDLCGQKLVGWIRRVRESLLSV